MDAGIPTDDLDSDDAQNFVLDLHVEEPTKAAVRIAHQVARSKGWYEGHYRSFYDAWRETTKS